MRQQLENIRIFGPRLAWRLFWHHWLGEVVANAIARRLPRRVVYWATIRLWAHGTSGPWSSTIVPELEIAEALTRWDLAPRKGT